MLDLSPREKAVFAPLVAARAVDGHLPRAVSGADPADRRRARRARRFRAEAGPQRAADAVIPAKAGIHLSGDRVADQWVPAFAGTTDREARAVTPFPFPAISPALPEIVLVCAAMALLLVGVFRGEGSTRLVSWLAVVVLLVTLVFVRRVRVGAASRLLRHVRDRRLRRVREGAGAARRRRQHHPGAALQRGAPHRALRVPGPDPARQHRHDADGVGERPDHPLSRPRTAKPVALCRRQLRPRLGALDRGRAEIFRPRRARLGHAALRRLADLRFRRHDRVRRPGATVRRRRGCRRPGLSSGSSSSRSGSPSRYRRCRSICGPPTSTKARRPRSPRSSRSRRRSPRSRCSCAS